MNHIASHPSLHLIVQCENGMSDAQKVPGQGTTSGSQYQTVTKKYNEEIPAHLGALDVLFVSEFRTA